jgi:hypothetical protein
MVASRATLPDLDALDPHELKALIVSQHELIVSRESEIEQLKLLIAKLRRMRFGRSSEKLDRQIEQLELQLEALQQNDVRDHLPDEQPPGSWPDYAIQARLPAPIRWNFPQLDRFKVAQPSFVFAVRHAAGVFEGNKGTWFSSLLPACALRVSPPWPELTADRIGDSPHHINFNPN